MLSLRVASAAALAFYTLSCSKPLSESECTALLDRYVEKLVASDRQDATAAELAQIKQKTRAKAKADPAFAECSSKVSRRQFECAMTADHVDRMEVCLM